MQCQQFAPPPQLQPWVRYFWTLENPDAGCRQFHTLADGCPGLILNQDLGGTIRDHSGKPWPSLLLYGQATQYGTVYAEGPFRLLGACLAPTAVPALFRVGADELLDSCLDLTTLGQLGRRVQAELLQGENLGAQHKALVSFLLAANQVRRTQVAPEIEQALAQLLASQGSVPLPRLQAESGLSARSFQRKFRQTVGVPSKLFARICQFQASLHQLRAVEYEKLSDLAYANQYADQSHHIRAFREFAGISPHQYDKQRREVMGNFVEVV